ncbi:hypothetical protein SOVF_156180 [Spinacia oleracea]|nr:hypothetical protein SOVF_156180 [Spinacia oleracea]
MECYQDYRPYTNQEYDSGSVTQVQQYNEYDGFNNGSQHDEVERDTMFADQKNYISYNALRGDQGNPYPGSHNQLQPANTWRRGHSKCNRCRG